MSVTEHQPHISGATEVDPLARSALWRALALAMASPENVTTALRPLVAGFSVGLFIWETGHGAILQHYLLTNELASADRQGLLGWLVMGSAVTLVAWLAIALILAGAGPSDLPAVLRRSANLLFPGVLLPFLPVFALSGFAADNPVLNLCVVSAWAGLALMIGQRLANDWGGGHTWAATASAASASLALVSLLGLGYSAYFSIFTIAKHNAFGTHSFDLGIFDQGLYTILHHGVMLSTQHGLQTIQHFGRHFSPILYLLAPIYALKQDARSLLVIQSLFLGSGAVPVYLLTKKKTASNAAGILFAASYLLYPALHGINNFDFHEIALAPPLLLFCLYFLETGRNRWFAVFLVLAMFTKEEVALSAVAIGAYIFLVKRRTRMGAVVVGTGLAYFALVNLVLMPAIGHGPLVEVYTSIMPADDIGFGGLLTTLATNPLYIFKYIFFNANKVDFLWQLLLPVLFLPLFAWRVGYIALPALAVPLLSPIPEHYGIGYQYPATGLAFIFFLAILALQDLQRKQGWKPASAAAAVLAVSLVMNYQGGLLFSQSFAGFARPSPHQQVLASVLSGIPQNASVSTLSDIAPHLSSRDRIYLFPVVNDADYLLLDTDLSTNFWPFEGRNSRADMQKAAAPHLLSGEYGVMRIEDGSILLKKGYSTERNQDGLRTLFSARFRAAEMQSDFALRDLPDDQALAGSARLADPSLTHEKDKTALTFGPYDALLPGKYRITYRLKLAGAAAPGNLATLDVFSNAAGGPLAGMDVSAGDFKQPGAYQDFVVDLDLSQAQQDIEYRVLYFGRANLAVDVIDLAPVRVFLPDGGAVIDLGG